MKKALFFAVIVALFSSSFALFSPAEAQVPPRTQAVVCRSTLTIFENPAINYDRVVGVIERGDIVDVLQDRVVFLGNYSWSEIRTAGGREGWVLRQWLDDYPRYAEVSAAEGLHLRTEPSVFAESITVMPQGTLVELLSIEHISRNGGYWYTVRTEDGLEGWAWSAYLFNPRGRPNCAIDVALDNTTVERTAMTWNNRPTGLYENVAAFYAGNGAFTTIESGTLLDVVHLHAIWNDANPILSEVRVHGTDIQGYINTQAVILFPFAVTAIGGDTPIRTAPDVNAGLEATLSFHQCVIATTTDSLPNNGGVWLYVEAQDGTPLGWVLGEHINRVTRRDYPRAFNMGCP